MNLINQYSKENEENVLSNYTEQVKNFMKEQINDNMIWKTFIKNLSVTSYDQNIVKIYIPNVNEIILKGHQKNFDDLYQKCIIKIFGNQAKYELTHVSKSEETKKLIKQKIENSIKENIAAKTEKNQLLNNFQTSYTFDNYLKLDFNKEAVDICKSIINDNNGFYILYISGSSGLGKSHLLHALGNEFKKNNKSGVYISPELFTRKISEMYTENNSKKISSLLNFFSNLDIVIFDDFQVFAEGQKKQTKNFIYQILDNRIQNNKITIISSENELFELENQFENKIYTRLQSGLVTKINTPTEEDMNKMLLFLLEQRNFDTSILDNNSINYIVRNHIGSIRSLIGAANRINVYKSSFKENEYVEGIIKNIFENIIKNNDNISHENIIKHVAKYYRVSSKEILGKSRKKEIVIARHLSIILIKNILNKSSTEIGKIFNRDHTTILSALNKLNDETQSLSINKTMNELKKDIYGKK
ncbi:DnaA ATPase domain-containing protein [Mycoplasma sp. CSL7503-lung]|uniref:DnaA ATPase domain-containing protein n=1 Tax=Mycoplasma sp. CSL7503-lung TaxID=536372 RepID=UPI0021D3BE79|nr:DnaA/Hda family protein [Mycoplasma sp. CSL7503-lung]MCU4706733.1 DnaA/Hda family protein [Mycoplasma sp. CSL7503-lung]